MKSHLSSKIGLKRFLREKLGEKYLEFMQDLQNFNLTLEDLHNKWHFCSQTINNYIEVLGYHRTAKVKQEIRNYYRVLSRVKERQERTKKLIKFIESNFS